MQLTLICECLLVRFRCIPIYPDLSAYYGTMDVFIVHPKGIILKRWENVQTNAGVISLGYLINDSPPAGKWKIKATVMGYEAVKVLIYGLRDEDFIFL